MLRHEIIHEGGLPAALLRWPACLPMGDSDSEAPVTRTRVPRSSRGRRASRRSGDDDAAPSQENHRAAGVPAGPGSAATATPAWSPRRDWPGQDADQAVTALYHAHCRSLVRIAALLAGDSTKAEEIVQDAFVATQRAWRKRQDGDKALGHLRRAVVTRACSQRAAPPDQPSRPQGLFGTGQPAPRIPGAPLVAVLSGLPARQREALVLKYYADWPEPQIAAAMGVSRHALNAHIRRGMSALQTCLAPDWGGGI